LFPEQHYVIIFKWIWYHYCLSLFNVHKALDFRRVLCQIYQFKTWGQQHNFSNSYNLSGMNLDTVLEMSCCCTKIKTRNLHLYDIICVLNSQIDLVVASNAVFFLDNVQSKTDFDQTMEISCCCPQVFNWTNVAKIIL